MFMRVLPFLLALAPVAGLRTREWKSHDDGDQVTLILNRMSKTGSSTAEMLVKQSLPNGGYQIVNEADGLTAEQKQKKKDGKAFVIGLMRNPCSVYLSMWSMMASLNQADQQFKVEDMKMNPWSAECWANGQLIGLGKPDYGKNLTSPEKVDMFRKWMKSPRTEAMNAYRFAMSWMDVKNDPFKSHCGPKDIENLKLIEEKVEQAEPDELADCWVKQETFAVDFKSCMEKYEKKAGKNVVDWPQFTQWVGNQNRSPHGECSTYFDKATKDLVEQGADKSLFKKFGYQGCCA